MFERWVCSQWFVVSSPLMVGGLSSWVFGFWTLVLEVESLVMSYQDQRPKTKGPSLSFLFPLLPLEHPQHSIGDHKPSDNIGGGANDSCETNNSTDSIVVRA